MSTWLYVGLVSVKVVTYTTVLNMDVQIGDRSRILISQNASDLSPVSTTRIDGPSKRPKFTGDRFPLPINMGRVDGRAFPLSEVTGRQHCPVNSASGK